MIMIKRLFLIVLDSLGIGELPDAQEYGDEGSNTLAAIANNNRFYVPNLAQLGLFNIDGVNCGNKARKPVASYGRLVTQSAGKDTIIGHWEIAGIISKRPLPTYPSGFPKLMMDELSKLLDRPVLCGKPYSGTKILLDYGKEHVENGNLIVYTSADSVLQIAAHEEIIPISELYEICEKVRAFMQGENGVGRIIARPFLGTYPNYTRTANRHDYSLAPGGITMLDVLSKAGFDVFAVGKIFDIFAGNGITSSVKTANNMDGMDKTIEIMKQNWTGLCFVNLVDFDMLYGHRNDIDGYAKAMSEFDAKFGELMSLLRDEDIVLITADHGCDPSTPSTDHSREYTPMLIFGNHIRSGINLNTRPMSDIAATVQDFFGIEIQTRGSSFSRDVIL